MSIKNPIIAVTHGDTNGIGYEMILKSFSDNTLLEMFTPIVYGSPKVAAYHRKAIDIPANFSIISDVNDCHNNRFNLLTTFEEEVKVELGSPSAEAGEAAFKALQHAVADLKDEKVNALVISPANNTMMQSENYRFDSEKTYIEVQTDMKGKGLLMRIIDDLRIAMLTDHQPLRNVSSVLTEEYLIEKLQLLHNTLRRDFGIDDPRIAVLSLNDCDANGYFYGDEEAQIIVPVVDRMNEKGMKIYGPYPTSDLFRQLGTNAYDAVLAMYEGQVETATQLFTDHVGCLYVAGLPHVVTLVDNGTDYNVAGENLTESLPLHQALYAAIDILRHRTAYDEGHANPLQKLYHERRDEGEKVRFAIPPARRFNNNERNDDNGVDDTPKSNEEGFNDNTTDNNPGQGDA